MTIWTGERVAAVLGTAPGTERTFGSISTDTRTLTSDALFVALVGDRFDGHEFLNEAERRGASGAVVCRGTAQQHGLACFEVDDTLVALGLLARARRREIAGPVVAITGTNGKTSTREMLSRSLGTRWKVHATRDNLNNLIGVPLTILAAPDGCEALVVEVGASEPREIARLRDVIEPSIGVVTNVAVAHLEGFGSLEGALEEKSSLLSGVPTAVVGTDPPALADRARQLAGWVLTAGLDASAEVRPDDWGLDSNGRGWLTLKGTRVKLPVLGRHQVDNAMLAIAAALDLGLDLEPVAAALGGISLPPGRCEVLRCGNRVILQDAYNANPGSLAALLDTAQAMRVDEPLVMLLGTMLELGEESTTLHAEMADLVMAARPSLLAVLGEFVPAFERYADELDDRLLTADDADSLGRLVAQRLEGNELVLVKGSRGMHLERAIPHLLSNDGTTCSTIS